MSLPEIEFGRTASRSIAWTCWGAALGLTLVLGVSALGALERAHGHAGIVAEAKVAPAVDRAYGGSLAFQAAER